MADAAEKDAAAPASACAFERIWIAVLADDADAALPTSDCAATVVSVSAADAADASFREQTKQRIRSNAPGNRWRGVTRAV
jgi:hypothetical protein